MLSTLRTTETSSRKWREGDDEESDVEKSDYVLRRETMRRREMMMRQMNPTLRLDVAFLDATAKVFVAAMGADPSSSKEYLEKWL